jgi:hypothetical protein
MPDQAPQQRFGGFWTGLAAGAGATALASTLRNRQERPAQQRRVVNNRLERDWDRGEGSSAMRTSTGFGGTSNR